MIVKFKNKKQIEDLIQRADNFEFTQRLTTKIQNLKIERKPFYLTKDELDEILRWKLRRQYGRQAKRREMNSNDNVIVITKAAFTISHKDNDAEIVLRLKLLCTLSGVEVPVASAILTLCFPKEYSVIDVRNWRQVYNTKKSKSNYTTKEYLDYLHTVRKAAQKYKVSTQDMDIAIWQSDIEQTKNQIL